MSTIIADSLKNKLILPLHEPIWLQFLEVIGEEIEKMREKTSLVKDLFNIYVQDEEGLKRIAAMFGYTPNLIVDNSLLMTRKEVESIPFRIRNKTTYDGYYIIFKQIAKKGEIYNYYWSGKKLIKAVKWDKIIESIKKTRDYTLPFTDIIPDKNFSRISNNQQLCLDGDLILDQENEVTLKPWTLDDTTSILPTKHLSIEYYVTHLGEFDKNKEKLITKPYLQYLSKGVEYNRRVPVVPHIGLQLTAICQEGGSYNFFNENYDYTVPAIKLKCATVYEYNKHINTFGSFSLDEYNGNYVRVNVFYDGLNVKETMSSDNLPFAETYSQFDLKFCDVWSNYTSSNDLDAKLRIDQSQIWKLDEYFEVNEGNFIYTRDGKTFYEDAELTIPYTKSTYSFLPTNWSYYKYVAKNDLKQLDQTIPWILDNLDASKDRLPVSFFKYISCGDGYLSLPRENMRTTFEYTQTIFFYSFSDKDSSNTIKDYSFNKYHLNLIGERKKTQGIIGKTINFDGQTYAFSDEQILITEVDMSWGFWFKADNKDSKEENQFLPLIDFGFLKFEYNYFTQQLKWTFAQADGIINNILIDTEYNIIVSANTTDSILTIYINSEVALELSTVGLRWDNNYRLYVGTNSEETLFWKGIIDSLWCQNKLLTGAQVQYIYEEKLGIITQLGNKLACYELDVNHESHDVEDWYMLMSQVKGNDITNEFGFFAQSCYDEYNEWISLFYNKQEKLIKINATDFPITDTQFEFYTEPVFKLYYNAEQDTYLYTEDDIEFFTTFKTDNISSYELKNQYWGSLDNFHYTGYNYYLNVVWHHKELIDNNYVGKTAKAPITSECFSCFYKKLSQDNIHYETIELKANKEGILYNVNTNEAITGTINFKTGDYQISSLGRHFVNKEEITNTLTDPSHIVCNLKGNSEISGHQYTSTINKGTIIITYKVEGEEKTFTAQDNGKGFITGDFISYGMVDYTTRLINIKFLKNVTDIFITYEYLEDLEMVEGSEVEFSYKVENQVITEIGFEDENHELLCYMSFPPVEFDTANNHISALMIVHKG